MVFFIGMIFCFGGVLCWGCGVGCDELFGFLFGFVECDYCVYGVDEGGEELVEGRVEG